MRSAVRLRALITKELIQVFRNPLMRAILFVAPALQLFVFTYAATTEVRHVTLAVVDRDMSATSRGLVTRLVRSGYFDLVAMAGSEREASALVDAGKAEASLLIPPHLEADLGAGRGPAVQLAVDGTHGNTAAIAMGYASAITAAYARERTLALHHAATPRPAIVLEQRAWFNPNLESKRFFLPGVLVMLITVITLTLTAMAVVREREVGTMEQLMVTPLSPWEVLAGKTLPFALIGLVDAGVALGIATFWFQVPLRGSLGTFFLAIALYMLTSLSAGLLISTVSRTQQQALLGMFFFLFPAILLSGFIFPLDNMPRAIRALTALDPLRYIMAIMRDLFLKGLGLDALWPQLAALAALGLGAALLAVSRFQRTAS